MTLRSVKASKFSGFFWNALLMVDIAKLIRWVNLGEKQAKLAVFAKNRRNPTEMQGKFWIKMASGPEIEQVRAKTTRRKGTKARS